MSINKSQRGCLEEDTVQALAEQCERLGIDLVHALNTAVVVATNRLAQQPDSVLKEALMEAPASNLGGEFHNG